jgi:hypothetical protein
MKTLAFEMPEMTEVANLMVERLNETTLKPDSPVICMNRGRKPLPVTFNGEHLIVPAGPFRTEYGAALHMQKHLIVPGTRNVEVGGFQSWIAILGSDDGRLSHDPHETHAPFTDEELTAFGEPIEAIARDGHEQMAVVKVSTARAMSRSQGVGGIRPVIDANQQATPAAREAAEHVFEPPAERETDIAQNEFAAEAEPAPRPRAMRKPR